MGEDISGVLDFRDARIACYAVAITLQATEDIDPSFVAPGAAAAAMGLTTPVAVFRRNTVSAARLGFLLPVPAARAAQVGPGFETSAVTVRWQLRFEFMSGTGPASVRAVSSSTHDQAGLPSSLPPPATASASATGSSSELAGASGGGGMGAAGWRPVGLGEYFRQTSPIAALPTEPFDCTIPIAVYGHVTQRSETLFRFAIQA
ncbi:hypothetical protein CAUPRSCDRAFT_13026 [Caulochytrium protostelioides]|uniref:Rgp1-domain-containing protein n=1 Tax=Caulochytrium protostelioides TaxID=1555241 RepID=A0A4P9WV36_9FUNG|nr:hypothetical protein CAUPRSCDRAFT_13026 [Caulochytrium protostelioides]